MPAGREVEAVLEQFGLRGSASTAEALGNAGGFSGAQLWRVTDAKRLLCLRRWPADYPDETRLRFIHAVLELAGMQVDFVPRLQRTVAGETAIRHGGHFWELTTWRPGKADFHAQPTPARLRAAMTALAQLHRGLEHFPTRMTGLGTSPGLAERRQRLEALADAVPELKARLRHASAELLPRGQALVAHFEAGVADAWAQLAAAEPITVPLQPCLRDVWHDHILFSGDEVTGVVDFDAARIETVAGDIARLLGSLVRDDAARRSEGLAAYEQVRPLTGEERRLIDVFDHSSVLMSGMNWLVWLLIEGRQFSEPERVVARLDEALARLQGRTERPFTA